MLPLEDIFSTITFAGVVQFMVSIAAILFAIGYVIYGLIFYGRLSKLDKTYTAPGNAILFAFAWLQIAISLIVLLYALLQLW